MTLLYYILFIIDLLYIGFYCIQLSEIPGNSKLLSKYADNLQRKKYSKAIVFIGGCLVIINIVAFFN